MDTLLTRLRTALAGRYEVEHELGRGGMAVVYLARDVRHDRRVALKVLRQDLGAGPESAQRFLREIRTTAQLNHPHILPLYDSGDAEGQLFYVMPYVEGESLRERLEREGPLPVEDAVRIAREVADALAFAHERGVLHRDIKPDNILLSAGHAAVADFGIARAADAAGLRLTETGLAVGTPVYMSPEQAMASREIDGRADQYALGCVLYEMLAGSPPFTGPTSQAVMARHTADPVPPLSTVRPVAAALETTLLRALAKQPADRWPTARAFAEALERATDRGTAGPGSRVALKGVLAAAGAVLLLGGAAWLAKSRAGPGRGADADSFSSVAVLPFATGEDTSLVTLADGLTEGVITGLVRVEGIRVPAINRVLAYRDRPEDPQVAGRALGVTAVLSARVRRGGNRLRVTAQLTRVSDGQVLWADQLDGDMVVNGQLQDVFTIQDEVTARIVAALRPRLGRSVQSLARGVRTRDPEAYNLYLEARREARAFKGANVTHAIELLRQALRRDSTFADAWAALASALSLQVEVSGGARPSDLAVETRRAAERAIELDSTNAGGFFERAWQRMLYDWDWDRAWSDARRAVRLAPASADAAMAYATFLDYLDEPDSALRYVRRAIELDPANSGLWAQLGFRSAWAGMPDSALAASRRALELDSLESIAYWAQVHAYVALGRRAEADHAASQFLRLTEGDPFLQAQLADYYRRTGNLAAARRLLSRLRDLARRQYVPPVRLGAVLLALGDRGGALDALEESVRNRDQNLIFDLIDSYYSLAGEPRFEAVRHRVFGNRPVPPNLFGERFPAARR